jgi:hypothetical protein
MTNLMESSTLLCLCLLSRTRDWSKIESQTEHYPITFPLP